MPVNPRSTLLIKPGDPSDVYLIGNVRHYAGVQINQAPNIQTTGDDVKQWHSVKYVIYNDYNDPALAAFPYPRLFCVVWRYYDSAINTVRPGVGGAGAASVFQGRGNWVRGESGWLGFSIPAASTGQPEKSYIVIPTYNCDRVYIERYLYQGSALAWSASALYGITPRSADGSIPPILGGNTSFGSCLDDTKCTVTDDTGAGAISLTLGGPTTWLDYELISVMCHFSAAPALAGSFTVVRNKTGVPYDTVLFSVDPSVMGLTNIVYAPKTRFNINANDTIVVAYANPSAVTYGVEIVARNTASV